mgnify:FL=1
MNKELTQNLIEWLSPYIPDGARSTDLLIYLRLFTILHFLAQDSYQQAVGGCLWISVSQASISRSISEICRLMFEALMPEWIKFTTDPEEKSQVKQNFYEKHGFSRVLRCIEGSHIAIVTPRVTDENHPFVDNTGPHIKRF